MTVIEIKPQTHARAVRERRACGLIDCASRMPSSLAQFFNDSAFVGLLPSKQAD